jgi:ABC-type transport system involved in multi-copper enzyme maturation permease subunit
MFIKLLRIELRKQLPASGFWILLILHSFVLVLVASNLNAFLQNADIMVNDLPDVDLSLKPILQFPDVWQNLTYISSYFKVILALIVITSVSSELSAKTARQNIIDGLSRRQWLFAKIGLAKVLALYSTLLVVIIALALGFSHGTEADLATIASRLDFVAAYFLELITYFIYALFISLLLKRTGVSLILLLVYDFIIEPILSWSLPDSIRDFLPMNAIDNLNKFPFTRYVDMSVPPPVSLEQLVWAVFYGLLFSFFSYLLLNKRDL